MALQVMVSDKNSCLLCDSMVRFYFLLCFMQQGTCWK